MKTEKKTLDNLFTEIEQKIGVFSLDHQKHANNTIENASKCAKQIRQRLIERLKHIVREAENDEICDVTSGLYSLLKDLGVKVSRDAYGDFYLEN